MGYFVLSEGKSWTDYLDAVIGNINLIKTAGSNDYDYLFAFAEMYLKMAKEEYVRTERIK